MPHNCCVPKCKSDSRLVSCTGLSFHSFPKDKERTKQWIIAIRRDIGPDFRISTCTRVCSLHFDENAYMLSAPYRQLKRLKRDAVPTKFDWTISKEPRRKLFHAKPMSLPTKVQLSDSDSPKENLGDIGDMSKQEEEATLEDEDSTAHIVVSSTEASPEKSKGNEESMEIDTTKEEEDVIMTFVENSTQNLSGEKEDKEKITEDTHNEETVPKTEKKEDNDSEEKETDDIEILGASMLASEGKDSKENSVSVEAPQNISNNHTESESVMKDGVIDLDKKDPSMGDMVKEIKLQEMKTDTPETISESDNDEPVYKINFDLDDLLASTLNDLHNPEKDDDNYYTSLEGISTQIKSIEKGQREINKIFADCAEKLSLYQRELEEADREEELREAAAEVEAKEAAEANARNEETDSDDDVQFISSSFDPSFVNKQQTAGRQVQPTNQSLANLQAPPRTVLLKIPPNMQGNSSELENMRAAFRGVLNQSVTNNIGPRPTTSQAPQAAPPKSSTSLTSAQTKLAYQTDAENINVNSKVLAKKFNDIWYKGTIVEFIYAEKMSERRYTVKFDGKGKKSLSSVHIAFSNYLSKPVSVGTRVIAMYRDEDAMASFYAGIVAETPNGRNFYRYLIFFDDGYAQYSTSEDIHKVVAQSDNVWEDIHPDSQEFIKDYLKQYPERPMVRLHKGQTVKTEWNGRWWTAKVEEVDSSLAKMFFLADKRTEWIYRGSTRLEPLFTALANAEASKNSGKLRRHNIDTKVGKKPVVEYTRYQSHEERSAQICRDALETAQINKQLQHEAERKKRSVAKKSTTNSSPPVSQGKWEAPWLKYQRKASTVEGATYIPTPTPTPTPAVQQTQVKKTRDMFAASSISSNKQGKDMASVLQERLSKVTDSGDLDEESLGERLESVIPIKDKARTRYKSHKCGPGCLKASEEEPDKYRGTNPLLIPLLCGWERHVCKTKPSNKRYVLYRSPCSRRVRNIQEADDYLMITGSSLTIDLFCFDPILHVHTEFVPVKTFCDIKDLSYGKENVPISCVNGIDRQYPDYVEYSNVRIPTKGVKLNLDSDFLVGCDCTDGCRDKSKCRCQQMTVDSTTVNGGKLNPSAGYQYRRLRDPLVTGLYECNSQCGCDYRCINRVAQNPLSVRLQVFKTEKRGWGLRCLDDIPSGGFICIYAGQLLTEQGANEDGQQYGDEYLAELDYIEVVERQKEGYESDANSDEGIGRNSDEDDYDDDEESDHSSSDSDSDFAGDGLRNRDSLDSNRSHSHRLRARSSRSSKRDSKDSTQDKPTCKLVLRRDSSRTSDHEEWSVKLGTPGKLSASAGSKVSEPILIDDDDDEEDNDNTPQKTPTSVTAKSASVDIIDDDSLPDLDSDTPNVKDKKDKAKKPEFDKPPITYPEPREMSITARRSTSGKLSRFKNLPDPKKKLTGTEATSDVKDKNDEESEGPGTRSFFQDGQACYIMDAKSIGNIGRYLNHSCSPNVFVQNVFVDTHDLRFPWVAFFAAVYIRAGTELTWDYNYEVGSVPGKVLYCYCGSADCRGRLL